MPRVLGPLAMNALKEIQWVLGLDYGGIDFGPSGVAANQNAVGVEAFICS
jgi:hypothetical protein